MIDTKETVAENIRKYRKRAGLTAATLAEKIGVSQAAVSDWETGKTMPRAGAVQRIANMLGVTMDDIVSNIPEIHRASQPANHALLDLESILDSDARLVFGGKILTKDEKELIGRLAHAGLNTKPLELPHLDPEKALKIVAKRNTDEN